MFTYKSTAFDWEGFILVRETHAHCVCTHMVSVCMWVSEAFSWLVGLCVYCIDWTVCVSMVTVRQPPISMPVCC